MKRKFKLITSIASLCLAVALMGVGVFAATAPKVTVSGNVSFTASNVLAVVTGYKAEPAATYTEAGTATATINYEVSTADAQTLGFGAFAYTDTNVVGGYRINVKNNFAAGSTATVKVKTAAIPATTVSGFTITVQYEGTAWDGSEKVLNAQADADIIVTVTVDAALAASGATIPNIGFVLDLTRGVAA